MDGVTEQQLYETLDGEVNSIPVILKHMAGSMRSCWKDFLTTAKAGSQPRLQSP